MYKKVLLPVNGRNHCARAKIAFEKIRDLNCEIVLLHVTEPIPATVGGEAWEELKRTNEVKGLELLGPIIQIIEDAGCHFHTRVEGGTPAETINRIADEENVDLIVMATDDRDEIKDLIMGSTTERVLRNTDKDLLAVQIVKAE